MLLDDRSSDFPSSLSAWAEGRLTLTDERATHFIFVDQGTATLEGEMGTFLLGSGMYGSLPGSWTIKSAEGRGIAITRHDWIGFFLVGGPIEALGRLRYIDGCTDSLIIPPVVLGDPCLNLLHIPPGTRQTSHTHPSIRLGMIVSGRGLCVTPDGDHPLEPGLVFCIPKGGRHSFHTSNEALRVIAYHPDSDFGPTHENHPMVNRTIVTNPFQESREP